MKYAIFMSTLCFIVLALAGVWYTHKVQRESEQKWCALLSFIRKEPQTAQYPEYKHLIDDLYRRNGCG